jgi:broad specificity phosphatase PhoE
MSHTLWLIRHGASTGNRDRVRQGQQDFPLTEEGRIQAERLATGLSGNGIVYAALVSSPLSRALETAEIISTALALPLETDPRWMERHAGTAEGSPIDEAALRRGGPSATSAHQPLFEDGESQIDLHLRAVGAIQDLLRRPPGHYLVVAHGGILSEAVRSLLGWSPTGSHPLPSFRFDNCAFARLSYNTRRQSWTVECANRRLVDSPHA